MKRYADQKRISRAISNAYGWLPIQTPVLDLLYRVETAFKCGSNTEFMSRLWGWSEPTIERALHIVQDRKFHDKERIAQ